MSYLRDLRRAVNDPRSFWPINAFGSIAGGAVDAYLVNGTSPATVADFAGVLNSGTEYYRVAGSATTFDDMFTYSDTASLRTMVDSDGALKWAPHNLALNSATPATQSITVDSGAGYTVEITGTGSVTLSNAGTGTVTAGSPVTITASTTTLTLTVSGSPSTMWAYRSDLGGMVNNPDTGTSYVPTTSNRRYLARRNHYRWTGAAYTKKGILLESAAATNLCTQSSDLTTTWAVANTDSITVTSNQGTGPDGNTSLDELAITDTTSEHHDINFTFTATAANWTGSVYVDDVDQQYVGLRFYTSANEWAVAVFNLTAGTVTQESDGSGTTAILGGEIEPVASGLYRISLTATLTAASTIFAIQTHSGATPTLTATDGTEAYAGAGTESFYAGDVQIELGSVPTSIMPTTGATFTRAAETLTIAGSNMAASTTAMSFHMQAEIDYINTTSFFNFWNWRIDPSNRLLYYVTAVNGLTQTFHAYAAGAGNDAVNGSTLSAGLNQPINVAQRITASDLQQASNGTATAANTTLSGIVDLSSTVFHLWEAANTGYGGTIALFRQDDSDWTEAGIEEASS